MRALRRNRRWLMLLSLMVTGVLLWLPAPAWAAAAPPSSTPASGEMPVLFPWAELGIFKADWRLGALYLGLGAVGALATVYFFTGELLPGIGGGVMLRELEFERKDLKSRRDEVMKQREVLASRARSSPDELSALASLTTSFDHQITELTAAIDRERRRALRVGPPLYVALGGFFAMALASNALQALATGLGWTAVLSARGLRKDEQAVKQVAGAEMDKVGTAYQAQLERYKSEIDRLKEVILRLGEQLAPKPEDLEGPSARPEARSDGSAERVLLDEAAGE